MATIKNIKEFLEEIENLESGREKGLQIYSIIKSELEKQKNIKSQRYNITPHRANIKPQDKNIELHR